MTYISMADTNKLMRKALKESFPGVKFAVRGKSYAGGASTNIEWTDGPNSQQVERIISAFEGSYFDGMIDYKGNRYAWLDGQEVSFATDFIFCNRDDSQKAVSRAVLRLVDKYAHQCDYLQQSHLNDIISAYHNGDLWSISPFANVECSGGSPHALQNLIRSALAKHTFFPFPHDSATLDRVAFKGDDGYGAGTVGPEGNGEGSQGYPSAY